jgi:hypothetical protein
MELNGSTTAYYMSIVQIRITPGNYLTAQTEANFHVPISGLNHASNFSATAEYIIDGVIYQKISEQLYFDFFRTFPCE